MPFKKGQSGNPAGAKPGVHHQGRPSDWFREQCQIAIQEARGIEFARDVLAGKDFPQLATGDGEVLPLPPALKERLKALEFLSDRGYGKPNQSVEVSGDGASELAAIPASTLVEIVAALTGGKA